MGDHVPLMFDGIGTSLPLIRGGKIKAFAVSTPKRSPVLPEVPTFTELGYPKLEALGWMGLWCTPDVPAAVQTRMREATLKVLTQPACASACWSSASMSACRAAWTKSRPACKPTTSASARCCKSIGFKPE